MSKINKTVFEESYAVRSGFVIETDNTVSEWLHDLGLKAIPCNCHEDGCRGWQIVHVGPISVISGAGSYNTATPENINDAMGKSGITIITKEGETYGGDSYNARWLDDAHTVVRLYQDAYLGGRWHHIPVNEIAEIQM